MPTDTARHRAVAEQMATATDLLMSAQLTRQQLQTAIAQLDRLTKRRRAR